MFRFGLLALFLPALCWPAQAVGAVGPHLIRSVDKDAALVVDWQAKVMDGQTPIFGNPAGASVAGPSGTVPSASRQIFGTPAPPSPPVAANTDAHSTSSSDAATIADLGMWANLFMLATVLTILPIWWMVAYGKGGHVMKKDAASMLELKQRLAEYPPVSIFSIVIITAYRFYTGFLNATWLPFLIAHEGARLTVSHQGGFMGMCKLIYGGSALMSPMLGLISDRLEKMPIMGRSPFVIVGSLLGGVGIIWCKVASMEGRPYFFFVASAAWMVGEALADTTTESAVPDLVPPSQYDLAGAVRSLQFIGGGMAGLVALIIMPQFHNSYDWLYVAYFIMMVLASIGTIFVTIQVRANRRAFDALRESRRQMQEEQLGIVPEQPVPASEANPPSTSVSAGGASAGAASSGAPEGEHAEVDTEWTLRSHMFEAYIAPMTYAGDFPRAMLSLFLLSCGMAPLFFTLLAVRDLVNLQGASQQFHFSCISLTFFLGAVVSSISATAISASTAPAPPAQEDVGSEAEVHTPRMARSRPSEATSVRSSVGDTRWVILVIAGSLFAMTTFLFPSIHLPSTVKMRLVVYYVLSAGLGLAFGCAYAIIQVLTWSLLPPDADIANAMGFVSVIKVVGLGISNIGAGLILDMFQTSSHKHVAIVGWMIMSWSCTLLTLASVWIQWKVYKGR